jgi:hypothetical protein
MQWLGRGLESLTGKVGQQVRRGYHQREMIRARQEQQDYYDEHKNDINPDTGQPFKPSEIRSQARRLHPYRSVTLESIGVDKAIELGGSALAHGGEMLEKFAGARDLMARAKAAGVPPSELESFIRQIGEQKQTLADPHGPPEKDDADELRPFLPIAGASDVELRPGENQEKKRTEALFADYKPPNWPLGASDNLLHLHNLILKGIRWQSPLDAIPPVLQGGSLLQGVHEYGDFVPLIGPEDLDVLAVAKQMRYKLRETGEKIIWRNLLDSASTFRDEVVSDVKFLFNPRAMGANNPQVFTPNELNPLCTPMHLDLRVGGAEPLYNLYGPCDAWSSTVQPGAGFTRPPEQTYYQGDNFNLYTTRPGYH